MIFTIEQKGTALVLKILSGHEEAARMIIAEELVSLQDLFDGWRKMESSVRDMEVGLLRGVFGDSERTQKPEQRAEI
jgi:hypothetical protein